MFVHIIDILGPAIELILNSAGEFVLLCESMNRNTLLQFDGNVSRPKRAGSPIYDVVETGCVSNSFSLNSTN